MRGSRGARRPARLRVKALGLTYLELVITLVMASVLMGAMMSAMLAVSKQESFTQTRLRATSDYAEVLSRLSEELATATAVSQQGVNRLEITVADRDGDGSEEIITYSLQGDELRRTQNLGAAQCVASGLADARFDLDYPSHSVGDGQGGEDEDVLLAYFDGYEGYSYDADGFLLSPQDYMSEYVRLDALQDAVSYDITTVSIRMARYYDSPVTITLSVYEASSSSHTPQGPSLGQVSRYFSPCLPHSPTWFEFNFADLTDLPATTNEICLVVQPDGYDRAMVSYCGVDGDHGPEDGMEAHWTWDGGASWSPSSHDWDEYDMRFRLVGNLYGSSGGGEGQSLTCRGVTVQLVPEDGLTCLRYVRLSNQPTSAGLPLP